MVKPLAIEERIALWIPRWHVETWLKHFAGEVAVVETEKYSHKASSQSERDGAEAFVREYHLWKADSSNIATLPSLKNAYSETERVDLKSQHD